MYDEMEFEKIVALDNGWFFDKETKTRFRVDEDGNVIGEDGQLILEWEGDDDEYDR